MSLIIIEASEQYSFKYDRYVSNAVMLIKCCSKDERLHFTMGQLSLIHKSKCALVETKDVLRKIEKRKSIE